MLPILLPYATVRVRTPLGRREVLNRLASIRSAEAGLELESTTEHSFRLVWTQRPWRQIPYLPLINGRLTDEDKGTDVQLVFSIQPLECLLVLGLFMFTSLVSIRAGEGVGFPIFCLFAYHLGGMVFGFRPTRQKGENLLRRILGSQA